MDYNHPVYLSALKVLSDFEELTTRVGGYVRFPAEYGTYRPADTLAQMIAQQYDQDQAPELTWLDPRAPVTAGP